MVGANARKATYTPSETVSTANRIGGDMMTVNSSSWLGDYIYSMLMFHHISECHERHHEGYTHGQASGHGIVNYVGSSQHRDSPFKFSASAVLPFKLWHRPGTELCIRPRLHVLLPASGVVRYKFVY